MFSVKSAAVALALASAVLADPAPLTPPTSNEGGDCVISWTPDATGKWTDVTVNSVIYFYQYSHAEEPNNLIWTTRWGIADASGNLTPPANAVQPDAAHEPVAWGVGDLANAGDAIPAPSYIVGQSNAAAAPAGSSAASGSVAPTGSASGSASAVPSTMVTSVVPATTRTSTAFATASVSAASKAPISKASSSSDSAASQTAAATNSASGVARVSSSVFGLVAVLAGLFIAA
ncbi:hypothetical protein FRB99_005552 [Tulasnella sp. 403]|nr:hypothetical protein FRB99_005552 [Tulasnella sp. 403]